MMTRPILYSYFRSSSAHRVRIALHLKNIDFEYRAVHLLKDGGEQRKAEYLQLNPKGEVPLFVDEEGNTLSQSMAIIEYLDFKWPQRPLFPKDPLGRCTCVALCELINSGIQPLQNLKVTQEIMTRYSLPEEERARWTSYWIHEGFRPLENELRRFKGVYSMGDEVSALDCFIVPQVFTAKRFQLDMQSYPRITEVFQNCQKLEAFQKSMPERQPDYVP